MTHPDFRALCAELEAALRPFIVSCPYNDRPHEGLLIRARAALAAPQQGAPSNGQIVDLANDRLGFDLNPDEEEGVIEFAHAVLTRYGGRGVPVAVAEEDCAMTTICSWSAWLLGWLCMEVQP